MQQNFGKAGAALRVQPESHEKHVEPRLCPYDRFYRAALRAALFVIALRAGRFAGLRPSRWSSRIPRTNRDGLASSAKEEYAGLLIAFIPRLRLSRMIYCVITRDLQTPLRILRRVKSWEGGGRIREKHKHVKC